MRQLDFEPIKSTEEFRKNYQMHDKALGILKSYLRQRNFIIINYGPDRRNERVWGDDKPDLIIWQNGYWLAFIDCKGHSSDKWMLNERAYNTYLNYSKIYQIPIICAWVNLISGYIFYDDIPFKKPLQDFMPHDFNKVIKTENAKHIDNLIKHLKITMI